MDSIINRAPRIRLLTTADFFLHQVFTGQGAIVYRDEIQIAIAENGGAPSEEGCFLEVDTGVIACRN